jgi:hypothetical protein
MKANLEKLRVRLASMSPGELAGEGADRVVADLANAWDDLEGSEEGGMDANKFNRSIEKLEWEPPVLSFQIERHGGYMQGSTRAELQRWNVDLEQGAAGIVSIGRRQLQPMDARLDVKRLASEIAVLIVDGQESPRLKWASKDRVYIETSMVIPATKQQTTSSRRKRFVTELERLLDPQGWRRAHAGSHTLFERQRKASG